MVKAADLLDGDHPILRLDGARVGTILAQGKMGPRPMVVASIRGQSPPQVTFVEDDDVVEALALDRADDTLDVRFCQGERGAVTTSVMPIASTRQRKSEPYDASRSRSR